jgi:hypothetical protein
MTEKRKEKLAFVMDPASTRSESRQSVSSNSQL